MACRYLQQDKDIALRGVGLTYFKEDHEPSSPSPPWLLQALGVKFYVDRNTQYAVNALRTNPQGRPILVLPEGTTTNGHIGLLEFHQSWFESFSGDMLQPVYLSAWRPFPKVALTTVESPFWGDIFWMFFSPFTLFTIRFLSPVHARVGADGVRGRIAEAGGLALTPHKLGDKKEMLKRMRQEAAERNQQANAPGNAYGGSFSYPIGQVRSGINIESFAERKRVMIEEARRKYIEKHGLNLPSTSLPSVN
ncbi:unnamed protein product [Cyprideis torosa]|uniref:Uncharacterized protein n=1 Tax=Cyprideis torosa TaxID=163714 RepID=A0A7R8W9S4_9CRUS|nr:unnamed protein product [Cyprideis torosa]CAG0890141.1 unnamed protein product [Cyprideis torosa]